MANDDLVSVGIPAYNKPSGLRRTLECITAQTYSNLEIIISNDGSPDRKTNAVALDFAERDSRVKYFGHTSNRGGFFNFGFVLGKATGRYFMWAADDDEWDREYIEACWSVLRTERTYDLVFTRYEVTSDRDWKKCRLNHNIYLKSKYKKPIFLLLDECISYKANLLYGLWRTQQIQRIWENGVSRGLAEEHMGKGFDNAFLTMAMGMADAYQIPRVLFFKRYDDRYIPGSWKSLSRGLVKNFVRFVRRPLGHSRHLLNDSKKQVELVASIYGEPRTIPVRAVFLAKRVLYILFRHVL